VETNLKQNTQPATDKLSLERKLGLLSAIAVLVGSTIGTGIFRSPAGVARNVPDQSLYLTMWAMGGFFSLCGALTLAEIATLYPKTGGVFVYLREGWGRLPAFLFGWSQLVVIRASALGAISTVFAEYFLRLLGVQNDLLTRVVAASAILTVALFNHFGVSLGALVQNVTTGAKYIALVVLVLAAFLMGANHPVPTHLADAPPLGSVSVGLVGLAFISMLWAYDGWADVTYVSGEIRRPERNLPIALIAGTLAVIAIYLLANMAYLHLLDINQVARSPLVAADAASRIIGAAGVNFISIAVMISAFGTLNGSMMTGSRIFFAMADDGLFFKKIAAVHPRHKTPYVAIWLAAVMAVVLVFVRDFQRLADMFVLGIWPFYAAGVAAVYVIRRRLPDAARSYRTLGYPITPALFILAVMFLLGNALKQDIRYYYELIATGSSTAEWSGALMVFAIVLAGIPAYYIWQKIGDREQGTGDSE
jgi:amino acid transporter